jgi:hypothetical protein
MALCSGFAREEGAEELLDERTSNSAAPRHHCHPLAL